MSAPENEPDDVPLEFDMDSGVVTFPPDYDEALDDLPQFEPIKKGRRE